MPAHSLDSESSAQEGDSKGNRRQQSPCAQLPTRRGDKLAYGQRLPQSGDACCEGLFERLTSAKQPTGQIEVIGCYLTARRFQPAQDKIVDLVLPASDQRLQVSATLMDPEFLYQMDAIVQGVPAGEIGKAGVPGMGQDRAVFHWNLSVLDSIQRRASKKIDWRDIMTVAFQEDRPFLNTRGRVYIPMHVNPPAGGDESKDPVSQIPKVGEPTPVDLMLRAVGGSIPKVTATWICLEDPKKVITSEFEQNMSNEEVSWMSVELPCGSGTWMLRLHSAAPKRREFQRLFVQAPEAFFVPVAGAQPRSIESGKHDDRD